MTISPSSALSGLAGRIERAEGLDAVAGPVSNAAGRLLSSSGARSMLSGSWMGHPLHPALIAVPLGCWTGASLLDLTGQRRAAQMMVGAGLIGVVPTALTGLSDWVYTSGAERRVGLAHMASNTVATGIYLASWRRRRRGQHISGAVLGALGAAVVTASGWLGGHLSYSLGVGVDTNAFETGPTEWTAVRGVQPGDGGIMGDGGITQVSAGSTAIAVVRKDGHVFALADRCSHRGGPLSAGQVSGGCITCPWHGSRFDLRTGAVTEGPAVVPQPVYEVLDADGALQVRRDEPRALRANATHP